MEGVYFISFEPNEWGIGQDQPFFANPYLLECRVVEDQDLVCVSIPYSYANDESIVMQVMETSNVFF